MIKHTLAIVGFMIASSSLALGQSKQQVSTIPHRTDAQRAAFEKLKVAVQAYRSGEFEEAQRLSEKALEIDPSNKTAPLFIARSIHAQFRPSSHRPESIAKARDAIDAYKRFLLIVPENEESYKAVADLYGEINESELQYSWILQRALNGAVSPAKRVEAYVTLGFKDWECFLAITKRTGNIEIAGTEAGDDESADKEPYDQKEFDNARRCVTRGIEMVDAAISLDSEYRTSWSLKEDLLLGAAKLWEMDGNTSYAKDYNRQANESGKRADELFVKHQQVLKIVEPESCEAVTSGNTITFSGPVLNDKAISKPQPTYPPIAKTARALGVVVVQITVDEAGWVIDASAVSGHPLLRATSVQAARVAVFPQTFIDGKPVKLTGVLCYTFKAQ